MIARGTDDQSGAFGEALSVQWRVIHALLMREVQTRYGRNNIGFLWIFAEPILFTVLVLGMWSLLGRGNDHHNIGLVPFLVSGYMPFLMWRHSVSRSIHCLRFNIGLLYHRQVKLLDVVIARMLLEIAGTVVSFAFVWALFTFFGVLEYPVDYWLLYAGWLYFGWFCFASGLLMASMSEMWSIVERLYTPFTYMAYPLGGAFYMINWLPDSAQRYASLNPMSQGFEMIRGGVLGPGIHPHYDMSYMFFVCLIMTGWGLLLIKHARNYVEFE